MCHNVLNKRTTFLQQKESADPVLRSEMVQTLPRLYSELTRILRVAGSIRFEGDKSNYEMSFDDFVIVTPGDVIYPT
jgi:hypothetical protein